MEQPQTGKYVLHADSAGVSWCMPQSSLLLFMKRRGCWLQIVVLSLSSNALEGTLPESWSNLQARTHLQALVAHCLTSSTMTPSFRK